MPNKIYQQVYNTSTTKPKPLAEIQNKHHKKITLKETILILNSQIKTTHLKPELKNTLNSRNPFFTPSFQDSKKRKISQKRFRDD